MEERVPYSKVQNGPHITVPIFPPTTKGPDDCFPCHTLSMTFGPFSHLLLPTDAVSYTSLHHQVAMGWDQPGLGPLSLRAR